MSEIRRTRLNILNPGFNRFGTYKEPSNDCENGSHLNGSGFSPWEHLLRWESPLVGRAALKALHDVPYIAHSTWHGNDHTETYLAARDVYPTALNPADDESIERAADSIAANVRQAREAYGAAENVSEHTRPILFFYGALALAQAASTALLGVPQKSLRHGLTAQVGPGYGHAPLWPTVITWFQSGYFGRLYLTARWDKLPFNDSGSSRIEGFHILECLRWLCYPLGVIAEPFPMRTTDSADVRAARLLPFSPSLPFGSVGMPLDIGLYEAPRIAVQYTVLYYFSILARYHAASWQDLLQGRNQPEGFPFRAAAMSVPHDFLASLVQLLPLPGTSVLSLARHPATRPIPTIDELYEPLPVTTDGERVYNASLGL